MTHPPTADNLDFPTVQNNPANIVLSGSDPENDPIIFSVDTLPMHKTLNATSGKHLTYTPNLNYVGNDIFTYHTNDGSLNSNPASVTMHTTPFGVSITTSSGTTSNPSQTITGTAIPEATINVYSGDTLLGTITADASGNWSVTVTLVSGANTITATATIGSMTSPASNTITVGTANTSGKVTGGGRIDSQTNFGFEVQSKDGSIITGELEYRDKSTFHKHQST